MPPVQKPKRDRMKHYFREWREKRALTQDQAMEILGWSQSKISRLESGVTPYNQDDLEAAAEAYGCRIIDLIICSSNDEDEFRNILNAMNEKTREQALSILKTLART